MGIFGKKKDKTLDLTARYAKQQQRTANIREGTNQAQSSASSGFDFLGGLANAGSQNQKKPSSQTSAYSSQPAYQTYGAEESPDEKKRKLAKRLMDLTNKLEEISNQIYHLQQRVELLEKKTGTDNPMY